MRPIALAGLPQSAVKLCTVGAGNPQILQALKARGISCIVVQANSALPAPVATHADLQLCHLGERQVVAAPENTSLSHALVSYGFHVTLSGALGARYPADAALDCAIIGKYCFAAPHALDEQVRLLCEQAGISLISVRQGYAKCSTCIVGERLLITADISIERAALQAGFSVLRIRPGHILLEGYDTGFIGGCSGLLGPRLLAFTGALRHHPDGACISEFLHSHGVQVVELSDGPLVDIGSIVPLMEQD